MTDLYELCRSVNRVLAAATFLWLVYRSVRAWPADWAKPDHVWHYRSLLMLGSGSLAVLTFGAFVYVRMDTPATFASVASTAVCLFAAGICAYWPPHPRSMRKDTP